MKNAAPLNPKKLDVARLAELGETLGGQLPLQALGRLAADEAAADATAEDGRGAAAVEWTAHGALRPVHGGAAQTWLNLRARARVHRTCQRCLQPVALDLQIERDFLFAPTEAQAEAWDAERDDADVLMLTRSLDLPELLEDELLLALPLVPRHETCPRPLPNAGQPAEPVPGPQEKDHPFAVLARLKRSP